MIKIEPDWIYVNCTDQQAKQLDAIWVKSRNAFRLPNTLGALRELYKMGYDTLGYGQQKAAKKALLLKNKDTKYPVIYSQHLRPYQNNDVHFLSQLPHAGIFSEMRTGKTPTTLKLLEAERHQQIIIVCPASLVLNWKGEIERWTNYDVFAVTGSKKKRSKIYQEWELKKGCLVLSKDTAKVDYDLLKKFAGYALVVDEAHFLRNYQTNQSKAVYLLGKNAVKRITITGTPATNGGQDLYGILKFLYPDKFPGYWQFVERYFTTWDSPWGSKEIGKYKREQELTEILETISVQRKRSEVMKWLPPKQYQTIRLEMPDKQRRAYNEMLNFFTVEEAGLDAPSVLAQLTRLRQLCLSPELLQVEAPSAKETFILEWLEDNPNEQVIIFSSFSSYLKKLHDKIMKFNNLGMIIGETSKEHRAKAVDYFQRGKINIILANIQAAGVGLTLDAAGTVIFLDRDYVPANNQQAEDRIVPTTETANMSCSIIDLVCENSIDEKINDLLAKKKSIIEVVNNYRNIKDLLQN